MMRDDATDFLSILGYLYLVHGKGEKAVAVFEALGVLQPGEPRVEASLAYAYLLTGRWAKCLHQADRYLKNHPRDGRTKSVQLIRSRALSRSGPPEAS